MAGTKLESSWVLEERLRNIACAPDLKALILEFISSEHLKCTGKRMSYTNLVYRGNLHYIEDNIRKDGLASEILKYITDATKQGQISILET